MSEYAAFHAFDAALREHYARIGNTYNINFLLTNCADQPFELTSYMLTDAMTVHHVQKVTLAPNTQTPFVLTANKAESGCWYFAARKPGLPDDPEALIQQSDSIGEDETKYFGMQLFMDGPLTTHYHQSQGQAPREVIVMKAIVPEPEPSDHFGPGYLLCNRDDYNMVLFSCFLRHGMPTEGEPGPVDINTAPEWLRNYFNQLSAEDQNGLREALSQAGGP